VAKTAAEHAGQTRTAQMFNTALPSASWVTNEKKDKPLHITDTNIHTGIVWDSFFYLLKNYLLCNTRKL